ncbi:MAG: hypothetical protein RJQ01_00745 [Microcella sp.]|uniref:PheS-related mystery ligase SrmL n=1 Tax=Microcella sp. TaxID=1913979 RepID=UPI003314975E
MYLSTSEVCAALAVSDLSHHQPTSPSEPAHALALLLEEVIAAATERGHLPHRVERSSPLVAVADNYDALGFDRDAVTRDRRYSHYVSPTVMLRSHTSAGMPALLRALGSGAAGDGARVGDAVHDEVLILPGVVHRRDQIDRTHAASPHQVDVWRVSAAAGPTGRRTVDELLELVDRLVAAALPGARWREVEAEHPYTVHVRQIDVEVEGEWLELAECGLIDPALLQRCGLDSRRWSGLALGLGLDRALMLRKGIRDIRLLRSSDARAVEQLHDLSPWRPISAMPSISRDLSIVIDEQDDDETLGDRVRRALGATADDLESVAVVARTPANALPESARARLGIAHGQVNALLRIVLRPIERTLTDVEANALRDRVYRAVHRGPVLELISLD